MWSGQNDALNDANAYAIMATKSTSAADRFVFFFRPAVEPCMHDHLATKPEALRAWPEDISEPVLAYWDAQLMTANKSTRWPPRLVRDLEMAILHLIVWRSAIHCSLDDKDGFVGVVTFSIRRLA